MHKDRIRHEREESKERIPDSNRTALEGFLAAFWLFFLLNQVFSESECKLKQHESMGNSINVCDRMLETNYSGNSRRTNTKLHGKETVENIRDAASCASKKLQQYYDISSEHCTIAVVLDPRHKLQFYEDELKSTIKMQKRDQEFTIK